MGDKVTARPDSLHDDVPFSILDSILTSRIQILLQVAPGLVPQGFWHRY
jgi:hypothetical protein